MVRKSALVKSKSSGSAGAAKEKPKKTTKSDAEFQPRSLKRRGVYVEKKENELAEYGTNEEQPKRKPPPRPKPGQKKFLTSVLNILSKSTTGTQYPDAEETAAKNSKTVSKASSKIKKVVEENGIKEMKEGSMEPKQKNKPKYKSRILNADVCTNDRFIILQSRREIAQTPSNYSEKGKDATPHELVNPIKELLQNNIYSGVAEGIAKEILQARSTEKIVKIQDDPSTLVSDVSTKSDKRLYNFFVDLLETTFDVYNVETDIQTKAKIESNTALEIDEAVAKKLNFKEEIESKNADYEPVNCCLRDRKTTPKLSVVEDDFFREALWKPQIKKFKSKSFVHPKKVAQELETVKKKPLSKKARKRDLLNSIKEELRMSYNNYEEPKNLYQALRYMATYKRKCNLKRQIRFDSDEGKFNNGCLLRNRKIFQLRKTRKIKKDQNVYKPRVHKGYPEFSRIYPERKISFKEEEKFESNHSLQVYNGIDFENAKNNAMFDSSSSSETEIEPMMIKARCSDSSTSMRGF